MSRDWKDQVDAGIHLASKERTALIDDLSDARAYHEEEYRWEQQRIGQGGSEIAAGRARRFSDAIAQAALLLSQSPRETGALRCQHCSEKIYGHCYHCGNDHQKQASAVKSGEKP